MTPNEPPDPAEIEPDDADGFGDDIEDKDEGAADCPNCGAEAPRMDAGSDFFCCPDCGIEFTTED